MRARDILHKQEQQDTELKICDFCTMKGVKKDRIEIRGLERVIVYKCIYCENETIKTLSLALEK